MGAIKIDKLNDCFCQEMIFGAGVGNETPVFCAGLMAVARG